MACSNINGIFFIAGYLSACDAVLKALKVEWPEYTKGGKNIFVPRLGQLEHAKVNAARALEEAKKNRTDNPTTHIHELVEYLQNIKRC